MIWKKWQKENNKEEFSSYEDILLDETDLKHIQKCPSDVFNKLLSITRAEMWKKALEGKITAEEARWAIMITKYLKTYFNK